MFVLNLKFDIKKLLKLIIIICILFSLSLFVYYAYNTYRKMMVKSEFNLTNDFIPSNDVATISPDNYTNILKAVLRFIPNSSNKDSAACFKSLSIRKFTNACAINITSFQIILYNICKDNVKTSSL